MDKWIGSNPMKAEADSYANLVESLHAVIFSIDLSSETMDTELARLEADFGELVYSELIHMLCHLRFEPHEAREHWERIKDHRVFMQQRLGTPVNLLVALVSYFVEVNRQLENPKLIELKVFEETEQSAYRDALTGLCNYRYFQEHLEREVLRSERYGQPLSLLMIDIDDFKLYNDTHGHDAGNDALARLAVLLSGCLRKVDVLARFGGEEFVAIMPATPKTGAFLVAERARKKVEEHEFVCGDTANPQQLTVSIGVATHPADARSAAILIRKADRALYLAKSRGKNRVQNHAENRRSFSRVQVAVDGSFQLLAGDTYPLTTIDISEGGVGFLVDRNLPVGSLIGIHLQLPGSDREIASSGRVVRVEEKARGRYETAIQLVDVSTEDRILLTRYIQGNEPATDEDEPITSTQVEEGTT